MPLDQKKADKNLQVPQETINANIGELVLQEPYIIDNFVSELVLQQPSNNSLISLNLQQMQEVVNNAIINFVPYKSQINNSALISLDLQQSENLCAIADIILPEHRGDTFVIDYPADGSNLHLQVEKL